MRIRVLRWLARNGLIEPEDVREMLTWESSGFFLDATLAAGRVAIPYYLGFGALLGDIKPGHSMSASSSVAAHSSREVLVS
jgi:hypothetical protein